MDKLLLLIISDVKFKQRETRIHIILPSLTVYTSDQVTDRFGLNPFEE